MNFKELSLNKRFRFTNEVNQKKDVVYVRTTLYKCRCVDAKGSYISMIGMTYDFVGDLEVQQLDDIVGVSTNVVSKYRF